MEDLLTSRKQALYHSLKEWTPTLVFWLVMLLVEAVINLVK